MKRIIPSNHPPDLLGLGIPKVKDPVISDISVDSLINDGLLGIFREMKNLLNLSAKGKLDTASAKDLRDTVKLLFELKDRESEILENIKDEDLERLTDGD